MKRSATHRPRLTLEQLERARRLSQVHSRRAVAEIMGIAPQTIRRAAERGWTLPGRKLRPVPSDWGLVAPGMGLVELAAHYHASQTTILRWRREKPVEVPHNGGVPWTPPDDFADLLAAHSVSEVSRRLGVHWHTVQAARKRLGLHPDQVAARTSAGWAERLIAAQRGSDITKGVHHNG